MKKLISLMISLGFLVLSCNNPESNPKKSKDNLDSIETSQEEPGTYFAKYAGDYTVEVEGYESGNDIEAYILAEDGSAIWKWIVDDGINEAIVKSEMTGKWTATKDEITISIDGESGPVVQEYLLRDGVFKNKEISNSYLKPGK